MTVYAVVDSQVGEVLGVCMSEELALCIIVQYATQHNLDLSEIESEESKYDPTCTYVTVEGWEFMVVEKTLIEEE